MKKILLVSMLLAISILSACSDNSTENPSKSAISNQNQQVDNLIAWLGQNDPKRYQKVIELLESKQDILAIDPITHLSAYEMIAELSSNSVLFSIPKHATNKEITALLQEVISFIENKVLAPGKVIFPWASRNDLDIKNKILALEGAHQRTVSNRNLLRTTPLLAHYRGAEDKNRLAHGYRFKTKNIGIRLGYSNQDNIIVNTMWTPFVEDMFSAGTAIYAIDENGEIYIGPAVFGVLHHSHLASGKDVAGAGTIWLFHGRVVFADNFSGHYAPDAKIFIQSLRLFRSLGILEKFAIIKVYPNDLAFYAKDLLEATDGYETNADLTAKIKLANRIPAIIVSSLFPKTDDKQGHLMKARECSNEAIRHRGPILESHW